MSSLFDPLPLWAGVLIIVIPILCIFCCVVFYFRVKIEYLFYGHKHNVIVRNVGSAGPPKEREIDIEATEVESTKIRLSSSHRSSETSLLLHRFQSEEDQAIPTNLAKPPRPSQEKREEAAPVGSSTSASTQ
jgi:hypothetical protein